MSVLNKNEDEIIELNEKLDTCASLYIECYQEILIKRSLLDKCLDNAYLNMSKARSLVGCSNLSILQIPNDLEPIVTVETKTEEMTTKTDDDNYELNYSAINYDLVVNKESLLSNKKDNSTDSIDENKQHVSVEQKSLIPFPNWFGVLTPLSLKTSQKMFSRSLYLITSICELQSKLKNLEILYKKLLKEKNSSA